MSVIRVRDLIVAKIEVGSAAMKFDPTIPLFESGFGIDSFGIVELILMLEADLKIQFQESDFKEEHFMNIGALSRLVESYVREREHEAVNDVGSNTGSTQGMGGVA